MPIILLSRNLGAGRVKGGSNERIPHNVRNGNLLGESGSSREVMRAGRHLLTRWPVRRGMGIS